MNTDTSVNVSDYLLMFYCCYIHYAATKDQWRSQGGPGACPPPKKKIGFTRKFLAALLSKIHKIVHGLAAKYP